MAESKKKDSINIFPLYIYTFSMTFTFIIAVAISYFMIEKLLEALIRLVI